MIAKAPPGPIKTKWGLGFRDYDECVKYIRESNSIKAPEGGLALPLPYTVYERPTYSVVPSNAVWRDPARADVAAILRKNEAGNRRRDLYFPQVMRDARRIGEYYPGLTANSPECMDRLGLSLAPSSMMMSPTLMPMRNSMRRSAGVAAVRAIISRCTSTAQRTASTTLANSTRRPSPVVLTMRPRCSAILGSPSSRRTARNAASPRRSAANSRRHRPP
jgi:hypothetical protein